MAVSLGATHASFETLCGAYGQFKITRYLLRVTEDSRYGDSMERVLYNTVAGAKPILPDKWPCCSGTFPQLAADYGISSYHKGKNGIYDNLFLPSKLT